MPEASEQPEPLDPGQQSAQEAAAERVNSLYLSRKDMAHRRPYSEPNRGQEESPKTLDTSKQSKGRNPPLWERQDSAP